MSAPLCLLLSLALGPTPAEIVDRIVAVVDDDPILLSDVERALAVGVIDPSAGPQQRQRLALDRLIEVRLRYHAVARSGVIQIDREQVDAELAQVRQRLGDADARLQELGLDDQHLRGIVRQQLELRSFVEERLGARVFISLDQVREHYERVLRPSLEAQGAPVPDLAEVREQIRALLREQAIDRELVSWTEELRRQADIIDLLDAPPRADPPPRAVLP
jgi:hypothetical protein